MPSINISKIGTLLGKGVVSEFAPTIVKGIVIEFFQDKKVDLKVAMSWVEQDVSLWDKIPPGYQSKIKKFAPRMGGVSWLDANWLIQSLKDELPVLASLFLGDDKAHDWLERQAEDLKLKIQPPLLTKEN